MNVATALTWPSLSTTVAKYIAEIRKIPLITRDEELALARRWRNDQDVDAAHKLVVSHLRFVVKIAREYDGYGIGLLDLVQEGNIGLMHAVRRFDPERGYRLITYAVWWIREKIQSFILRTYSLVKIGAGKISRRLFYKLRSTLSAAEQETGGSNEAEKLASERLGVSEEEVTEMEVRLAARDHALDVKASEDGTLSRVDLCAAAEPSQEERVSDAEERRALQHALSCLKEKLDDKEQYILEHRLLQDEPETLSDVGARFGVTRQRVQQIEGRLVEKIRKHALQVRPELRLLAASA